MPKPNPMEPETIEPPPGLTGEEFVWLCNVAESTDRLPEKDELWCQRDRLESAVQSMETEVPRLAAHWLPACMGLVKLADEGGYADLRAAAQMAAGRLCWVCARYQEALELFEESRGTFESISDLTQTAVCCRSAGAVYHQMGRPKEAREMYQHACRLFEELNDRRNAAICYFNIGLVEFQTGHSDKALEMYGQAHDLFEQVEDSHSAAVCQLNIGIVYADSGRAATALSMYERARVVFESFKDSRRIATCYHQAGLLYSRMGRMPEALVMYDKAKTIFDELGDRRRVALCFLNAANHVYARQGYYAHARAMYDRARPIFEELQDKRGVAGCYLNAGDSMVAESRLQEAQTFYDQARTLFEDIEDVVSLAHCYTSEGEVWARMGEFEKAEALYAQACRLLKPSGDVRSLMLCHQRQGDLYRQTASHDRAVEHYEEALKLLESLRDALPDPEMAIGAAFTFEHLPASLATTLIMQDRPNEAFHAAQWAKGALLRYATLGMRVKRGAILPEERAHLRKLRTDYEEKRMALVRVPSHSPQYRQLYREQEAALAELNAYEMTLRSRVQTDRTEEFPHASLEEIALSLGHERAILEILVDHHHVCLLFLKSSRKKPYLRSHMIDIERLELQTLVKEWLEALKQGKELSNSCKPSERLYQFLIAPFEADLEGVKTLILCPDHCLHAVPFGALQNDSGQYLIEPLNLVNAPSACAWDACLRAIARQQAEPNAPPLIVGVSQFRNALTSPAAVDVLVDLPHARIEAEIVRSLLGEQAQTLIDDAATVGEVSRLMPHSSLLHFATHAFANETAPLMGALALTPDDAGGVGLLYARDIYEMNLNASLTVLSACSTAQGQIAGGEGLIGLAWAFLMAGCPTVAATRWEAHDEAARLWVESFYRAYIAGCSKAESARQACLHLIKQPVFAAPHFWAGWTIIGSDV